MPTAKALFQTLNSGKAAPPGDHVTRSMIKTYVRTNQGDTTTGDAGADRSTG
jgi:hypothetical protein